MQATLKLEFKPGPKPLMPYLRRIRKYKGVTDVTLKRHKEAVDGWESVWIAVKLPERKQVLRTIQNIRQHLRKPPSILGASRWVFDKQRTSP